MGYKVGGASADTSLLQRLSLQRYFSVSKTTIDWKLGAFEDSCRATCFTPASMGCSRDLGGTSRRRCRSSHERDCCLRVPRRCPRTRRRCGSTKNHHLLTLDAIIEPGEGVGYVRSAGRVLELNSAPIRSLVLVRSRRK